jgi:hypothetical protein
LRIRHLEGAALTVRIIPVIWCFFRVERGSKIRQKQNPRPALIRRADRAAEGKAVVRIEVAAIPRPCLGCAVELALRVAKYGFCVFLKKI